MRNEGSTVMMQFVRQKKDYTAKARIIHREMQTK